MSARSMNRARTRELEREQRRGKRRARQASAAAVIALGAGAALAPGASAATFTVNSNADTAAPTPCDATCTLRDAIDAANANAAADTINFASSVTGQITIANSGNPFPVDSAMQINGPGAGTLAISGNGNSQIFYVQPDNVGADNDPVTISGLTLRDGDGGDGAAVYSDYAALTLDQDVLRGNNATGDAAVYMQDGSLTVTNSTFAANHAGSGGGAIYTDNDNPASGTGSSSLVVRNSTFRGNSADYAGGAIYVDDQTDSALIAGSTFQGNSAGSQGGAIKFYGPEGTKASVVDSTISGNTAGSTGGGVASYGEYDKPVEILDSTISGNSAGDIGGGVYRYAYDDPTYSGDDTVVVSSSIVAGNDAPVGSDLGDRVPGPGDDPISGSFQVGYSLLTSSAGSAFNGTPASSNKIGVDPLLGPLADNGGPTKTHLPALASPAIDAGLANGLTTDQRGLPRTVQQPTVPDAAGSDGTDIGAVELAAVAAPDTTVDGAFVKVKKNQKVRGKVAFVKIKAGAQERVKIVVSGSVKLGKKKIVLKKQTKTDPAPNAIRFKLKPKKKADNAKIFSFVKKGKGKSAKASLTLKFTDDVGNTTTKQAKTKLIGPRTKK